MSHGKEGDRPIVSHSIGDCYIRHRFCVATHETINCEAPGTMRRVLLIHLREALGPADPLSCLRPLEHKLLRKDGSYGLKVVRAHEPPELMSNFYCGGLGHGHISMDG